MPQEQPTATRPPTTPPRRYIGDGVYAHVEPGMIVLETRRPAVSKNDEGWLNWIGLGPDELNALGAYLAQADHMLALKVASRMIEVATQRAAEESKATLQEIGAALETIARKL